MTQPIQGKRPSKSPFFVIQEFISPLMCEEIIDQLDFTVPDVDKMGHPVPTSRTNPDYGTFIYDEFAKVKDHIMSYYGKEHDGTTDTVFTWFSRGTKAAPTCENSTYIDRKWVRTSNRDFTAVLFLSTYNNTTPFDETCEVYGGKLEFPQHKFGFNPQQGTLIVFPSEPHFINVVTPILAGDLYTAKFHIATTTPFLYDPKQYPGDYRTWLEEFA